jgi:hypothetical protein
MKGGRVICLLFWRINMRYLKPYSPVIIINDKEYKLLFSLDAIDNIQDRTNMPMTEIITSLFDHEARSITIQVLIKYLTGQVIEIDKNQEEYYSTILLNTYINQMKYKDIQGLKMAEAPDGEYEFTDVEHWFYIGTVVLERPEERVWNMSLGELRTLYNEHAKYNGWFKEEKEQSMLSL